MHREPLKSNLPGKNFEKEQLRAVLDSADIHGVKNKYIDLLHKMAISKNLKLTGKELMLDFGCGNGRLALWFTEKVESIVGLDVNYELLKQAKMFCQEKNIKFLQSDGIGIPLLSNSFDFILSVAALQAISDAIIFEKNVGELARVCKPNGTIFAIEQVAKNVDDRRRTPEEYTQTFQQHGLSPVVNYPIRYGRSFFIKAVSLGIIPQFLLKNFAWFELNCTMFKKTPKISYHEQMMIFVKQ